jgi:glycosyltransferase involved in cell wall biosynthesis
MLDVAAAQRDQGHVVDFFSMDHPDNEPATYAALFPKQVNFDESPAGLRQSIQLAKTMIYSTDAARSMQAVIDRFKPDVVHMHNIYHQLSPSILKPLAAAGIPAVMTVHDFKLVCPTYRMLDGTTLCDSCVEGGVHNAIRKKCNRGSLAGSALVALESGIHRTTHAYGHISRFIAPSTFLERLLIRGAVYPERIRVVPHFVDTRTDPFAHASDRSIQPNAVFIGRLSHEKGVDIAINAFAKNHLGHLNIVGSGPEEATLRALAERVAPGRVTFHGHQTKSQVNEHLRRASLLVLAARYFENQPMSILEAFANGVPVVGTDLGGIPELVQDNVTGRLVPPNDPETLATVLDSLFADPTSLERLAHSAFAYAHQQHGAQDHLAALDAIYSEVTAK